MTLRLKLVPSIPRGTLIVLELEERRRLAYDPWTGRGEVDPAAVGGTEEEEEAAANDVWSKADSRGTGRSGEDGYWHGKLLDVQEADGVVRMAVGLGLGRAMGRGEVVMGVWEKWTRDRAQASKRDHSNIKREHTIQCPPCSLRLVRALTG